jgi:centromeric protein E
MVTNVSERVVLAAMEGFNGTVFTYGQTGSGKTHSMMGTLEDPGVIRGSVITVFGYIAEHPTHEFMLRVSVKSTLGI